MMSIQDPSSTSDIITSISNEHVSSSVSECPTSADEPSCTGVSSTSNIEEQAANDEAEIVQDQRRSGKKLSKEERYLRMKEIRKLKRKEKKERRKALRKATQMDPTSTTASASPPPQRRLMADSECSQRIVIDCSFDDLMKLKDVCKLHHQLNQCYGLNRRAKNPCQLYVSGVSGLLARRFEETDNTMGASWDVFVKEESLTEIFDVPSIVYLSSESETVLDTLDPQKVYVIGGLVDHNHHKGHCHRVATEAGIATARLPIDRYLRMNSRCVLTVNHVFQIMLMMTENNDWSSCLQQSIPRRKWVGLVDSDQSKVTSASGDQEVAVQSSDSDEDND